MSRLPWLVAMLVRIVCFAVGGLALYVTLLATRRAQAQNPPATAPEAPTAVAVYSIASQKLEVRWSSSDYAATTGFKVQWKSGTQDYDTSRQASADPATSVVTASSSTTTRRYKHTLTGLTDGTEHTVQVIATNSHGDSDPSPAATGTPQSTPGQALAFIENEVVTIHESAFPWLRKAWDYLDDQAVPVTFRDDDLSVVISVSNPFGLGPVQASSVAIGRTSLNLIHVITHELGHVYTLVNNVTTTPGPLGIAHVYFSALDVQETNCHPNELYADTLMILVHGDGARQQSNYWSRCIGTDDSVTEAALAVVRSAVAGQTPSWFADTYHDTNGEPDLEQLWSDVKAISRKKALVYQLRNEFGGYCSNQKAFASAFGNGVTRNPWRDGGCVPEAPGNLTATSTGKGKLTVSWAVPASDGGSPIEGYRVQWKSGSQEYDSSRQAEVTNLSYTISGLAAVEYMVQVLAYNTNGDGTAATATATATDTNDAPAFPATETGVRSVAENTRSGVAIGAPVAATDPNNDRLTYTLGGADATSFEIVATSGQLRTKAPLDRETKASYGVTVSVRDGEDASGTTGTEIDDTIAVTITVADVDEPPTVTGPTSVNNYAENGTGSVGTYSATDPENDALTWSLTGADAGKFGISSDGVLRFAATPDYEARADAGGNNVYNVTVVATAGGKTGTRAVTVTVTDVNEAPVISGPTSVNNYTEGGMGDVTDYNATDPERRTIIWSLAGADRNAFTISSDGVLRFAATPDYEAPADAGGDNEYRVTVQASDGEHTGTRALTVTVENAEETGTISLSSEQPQVGTQLTATLTDPDGSITGRSWKWERSPNRSSWTAISGAATAQYTPVGGDLDYYLRVTASYTDGHGAGKSVAATADHRVEAAPGFNQPPQFPGATAERSIAENSPAQTPVGDPVTATDPEGHQLAYTLTAGDVDSFTIDGDTGQLRVKQGTVLDYETGRRSYSVTVTATDPSLASASTVVTITVADVNEPPDAANDTATTAEDAATVVRVLDNDPDPEGQGLTVSLRRAPHNGTATVGADHTITYTPRADFHGTDTFAYRASDGVHDSAAATVIVTVTPVNDPPEFSPDQSEVPVGGLLEATDRDGDTLTYTLSGPDAHFFDIDRYTAKIKLAAGTVLDPATRPTYTVTVTARDPSGATASIEVTINAASGGGGDGGGGSGGGGGGPPAPPPAPPRSPIIGSTPAATAKEVAGDLLVLQRHDQPGVEVEVGVGWISQDGQRIITIGFVRDGDLGQTYAVVRREGDGLVVRRWIAPDSHLVYAVPWASVNTQYTFPVGVILAIPLDDQHPPPNMLTRRFDGSDDRILAYDAELGQWRHVPDEATFQARGYYWCNVTAADAAFFKRISQGSPYPASTLPAQGDYPNCLTT